MSDLLNIGASGVRAYQSALTTISENIANAGAAGYTRRSTNLSEVTSSIGDITQRRGTAGNGVLVTGVSRSADNLRSTAVRTAGADLARTETGVTWLSQIEGALTGNSLGDQITAFFNAAKSVAADPTATAPRATLLEQATSVAGAFTATGNALAQADADLDSTTDAATASLDRLGASLAKVNDGLSRTTAGASAAAQLGDQRDQILESISALTDTNVSIDDIGRATVRLGNANGPIFVAGADAGHIAAARGEDGNIAFSVVRDASSTGFTANGGALAGIADGAQRIAAARDQLDGIAGDFAAGVNAVQVQGRDLNGEPGAAIFATGSSPTDVTVTLTDPDGIAAASVGGGARDNSNLNALNALRTSGNYESRLTDATTSNAAALAQRKSVADAQTAIHDGAIAARDAASGVNLDSEAVDLLRFQQAYAASSRVIQVARDTFQSILDIR